MALLCVSFHTARKSNKGPLDTDMPIAWLSRCLSARPLLSGRFGFHQRLGTQSPADLFRPCAR